MNAIEIHHITKDYGNGKGVFDVSFSVRQGEIMGFLGPNGAGKTTTIRQLMGFIRPDSGSLSILGKDCFSQADVISGKLGYLPGETSFIDSMEASEFIRFVSQMKGMKTPGRTGELLERFSLDPHGKIRRMSKGTRQKLAIVCAFLHDPEILILDEPTSGLDPLMQNAFLELIQDEKERGKTILMSSHIFEEIEKTCSRTAIIHAGKLISVEDMTELKSNRKKIWDLTLTEPSQAQQLSLELHTLFSVNASFSENKVTAALSGSIDAYLKLFSRYTILDLNIHTLSLEELFLHFYEGRKSDDQSDAV